MVIDMSPSTLAGLEVFTRPAGMNLRAAALVSGSARPCPGTKDDMTDPTPSPTTHSATSAWAQIQTIAASTGYHAHLERAEHGELRVVLRSSEFYAHRDTGAGTGPTQEVASTRAVEEPTGRSLMRELQAVLNRYSAENGSNTPDFILAELLVDVLGAYDKAVQKRAKWYGRMDRPAQGDDSERIAHLEERVHDLLAICDQLRPQAEEHARIRDLLHERLLRLRIRDKDAPPGLVDIVRGLIDDAHVPGVDARDMADLRTRAERAEAELERLRPKREALQRITLGTEKFALPLRLALDFLNAGDGEPRTLVLLRALSLPEPR